MKNSTQQYYYNERVVNRNGKGEEMFLSMIVSTSVKEEHVVGLSKRQHHMLALQSCKKRRSML